MILTADRILTDFITNEGRWAEEWERYTLNFRVGPATAQLHSSCDGFRTIYSVHVKERYRGKGRGRALMSVITAYADERGHGLRLQVFINNEPAVRLYTSAGFHITETWHDIFGGGIHTMIRYPSQIPDTEEWRRHFEEKAKEVLS